MAMATQTDCCRHHDRWCLINVGSRVNDAYTLINAGLPVQIWEAIGASAFFMAVIFLLYRWDRDRPAVLVPTAAIGPAKVEDTSTRATAPPRRSILRVDVEALTVALQMYDIIHKASQDGSSRADVFRGWAAPRRWPAPRLAGRSESSRISAQPARGRSLLYIRIGPLR